METSATKELRLRNIYVRLRLKELAEERARLQQEHARIREQLQRLKQPSVRR